jgi:hypothetical protein
MVASADDGSPISINRNGGFFKNGRSYAYLKKWEVAASYFWLWEENWPVKPSMRSLAKHVGVEDKWAEKVIDELTATSQLENPSVTKLAKKVPCGVGLDFTLEARGSVSTFSSNQMPVSSQHGLHGKIERLL